MPIEPGQTLLHYRIVDKLGEGGMGVVWRAIDTTLDREVAIKLLPAALGADPERLARFDREAKLLASLNHPSIAGIYGAHEVDTSTGSVRFLAMELVAGEDLAERLARGPIPVDEAVELASEIAAALAAAHEAGVIHRDLKPANVRLTPDGQVKVLDFGLAKALSPETTSEGVWAYDLPSGRGRRLPGRRAGWPVWSNDGEMVAYSDDDAETLRIESVTGTATGRSPIPNEWSLEVYSWSPDDRVLAVSGKNQGSWQIGFLDLEDGTVAWVDSDGIHQWGPAFSPDGKWVAYSSWETGTWEVWVRSYPDGSVVRQISDGGGLETVWSPSGELFYRRGDRWMSVAITTEPTLSWSAPRQVFETDFVDTLGRSYDVSSDGQSLYVVKQPDPPDGTRVHVVTGWRP